ncbi:MAG: hypothetical protein ABH867_00735 [Patescibacteria group bacterium]
MKNSKIACPPIAEPLGDAGGNIEHLISMPLAIVPVILISPIRPINLISLLNTPGVKISCLPAGRSDTPGVGQIASIPRHPNLDLSKRVPSLSS